MKQPVKQIPIDKIKSKWHNDLIADWQPDKDYIQHLKGKIAAGEYIAPIVVVKEDAYYIVNGHHRYYAHLVSEEKKIKCILIDGTFEESEPLRKAEVLLKEYDQKNEYRYQFSGYLDRWAAAAEEQGFINKYRPTYKFRLYKILKKIVKRLTGGK
ncbi:MAG: ParB N-terminal domain-containing protein [bacterium]|nr:ParB N-terminal domain-containing protein [bacterium]